MARINSFNSIDAYKKALIKENYPNAYTAQGTIKKNLSNKIEQDATIQKKLQNAVTYFAQSEHKKKNVDAYTAEVQNFVGKAFTKKDGTLTKRGQEILDSKLKNAVNKKEYTEIVQKNLLYNATSLEKLADNPKLLNPVIVQQLATVKGGKTKGLVLENIKNALSSKNTKVEKTAEKILQVGKAYEVTIGIFTPMQLAKTTASDIVKDVISAPIDSIFFETSENTDLADRIYLTTDAAQINSQVAKIKNTMLSKQVLKVSQKLNKDGTSTIYCTVLGKP